jgi:hypothetical protein
MIDVSLPGPRYHVFQLRGQAASRYDRHCVCHGFLRRLSLGECGRYSGCYSGPWQTSFFYRCGPHGMQRCVTMYVFIFQPLIPCRLGETVAEAQPARITVSPLYLSMAMDDLHCGMQRCSTLRWVHHQHQRPSLHHHRRRQHSQSTNRNHVSRVFPKDQIPNAHLPPTMHCHGVHFTPLHACTLSSSINNFDSAISECEDQD